MSNKDLKLKIIGYELSTPPSAVEAAVNHLMAQVNVDNVQVVPMFSTIIIHIFYTGEEPKYEQPTQ